MVDAIYNNFLVVNINLFASYFGKMSNNIKKRHLQSQVRNALKPKQYEIDDEQSLAKLKTDLSAAQKKLTKYQSQEHNASQMLEESETDENQLTQTAAPEDDDDGMYGADYIEKMVCIGNHVYCRKNIHDMAVGSSHLASHVARKLLDGVFKIDFLIKSTLTGQTPRAQGLNRQLEPVSRLNNRARQAIIDYAMNVAKDRGWVQQPMDKIQRAMTQRIGELKRLKRAQ